MRQKLDRLDDAFLYAQTIDIDTYDGHKDRLREGTQKSGGSQAIETHATQGARGTAKGLDSLPLRNL
jgi:hypothetical protein